MSIFLSAFIGIFTFFLTSIFIKPVIDLRKCIGKIYNSLLYYANIYTTSVVKKNVNVEDIFRKHATLIVEKAHLIKCYKLFVFMTLIPKIENIKIAHRELIGLSNCANDKNIYNLKANRHRRNKIAQALNLKIIEEKIDPTKK